MKNIYEEYAKTKQAIAELQDKLKELEPKILGEISALSAPMKTDYGTFIKQTRTTYKFSRVFQDLIYFKKQEIQKLEQKEIEEGRAEKQESTFIRFIVVKEK